MLKQGTLKRGCRKLPLFIMAGMSVTFSATASLAVEDAACEKLVGTMIPKDVIGLPTTGAEITSAEAVAATEGDGGASVAAHCLLQGAIHPVDFAAPDIGFKIGLPADWNKKIMMFGGGGYNGTIPDPINNVPAGPVDKPTPLSRGYAVFGGDSGHQSKSEEASADAQFGVNDEALQNFSGDAIKKTRDAALHIIKEYYAAGDPERAYFAGGSTGGREALAAIQRWPEDWDGAISLYPAWNAASLDLQFGRITRAFAEPGAYLNQTERQALFDATMQVCDAADGVEDGLIGDMNGCNASFDPATATLNGSPLRCENGEDTGDSCLSDAQITAMKVYASEITFDYELGSGETSYPGFNVYGADLGLDSNSPSEARIVRLALGSAAPAHPMPDDTAYFSTFWDQWIRYVVTRDPDYDSLSVDPASPGPLQKRIAELTKLQDVNDTDLSDFAAKGGKLLMAHGTADVLVSNRSSQEYFGRVQETMGKDAVQDFARYYEVVGYGHAVNAVFNASWDSLTTLENWVEKGVAPPPQIVADTAGVPGRKRPLCEFPGWPKYTGSGDVNDAASFECTTE